jgi:hypothetical protein
VYTVRRYLRLTLKITVVYEKAAAACLPADGSVDPRAEAHLSEAPGHPRACPREADPRPAGNCAADDHPLVVHHLAGDPDHQVPTRGDPRTSVEACPPWDEEACRQMNEEDDLRPDALAGLQKDETDDPLQDAVGDPQTDEADDLHPDALAGLQMVEAVDPRRVAPACLRTNAKADLQPDVPDDPRTDEVVDLRNPAVEENPVAEDDPPRADETLADLQCPQPDAPVPQAWAFQ